MSIDIEQIRARAEAATPGPWDLVWDGQTLEVLGAGAIAGGGDVPVAEWLYPASTTPPWRDEQRAECDTADAEFIAHAREDVPALLDEVERLRAAMEREKASAHEWREATERRVELADREFVGEILQAEAERDRLQAAVEAVRAAINRADPPDTWRYGTPQVSVAVLRAALTRTSSASPWTSTWPTRIEKGEDR